MKKYVNKEDKCPVCKKGHIRRTWLKTYCPVCHAEFQEFERTEINKWNELDNFY